MTYCTMTAVAVKETLRLVPSNSVWDFGNQRFTAVGHGVSPRKPTDRPRRFLSFSAELAFPLFEIPR